MDLLAPAGPQAKPGLGARPSVEMLGEKGLQVLRPDAYSVLRQESQSFPELRPAPSMMSGRVRVKNRRKKYLDTHPQYFEDSQLEMADPLLYDRLIRRFQSASEREEEGRRKGYSGVLEADLYRGEAKLAALKSPDPNALFTYKRGPNGEILAEEKDEIPPDKDSGLRRWRWEMEIRFIRGDDDDFDYKTVDDNDLYDDRSFEDGEAEERYFGEEEPEFVVGEDGVKRSQSKELEGETGIQDF